MRIPATLVALAVVGTVAYTQTAPEAAPTKLPPMPDSAKPSKEIAPFAFMAGDWVGVNPNGTVNEEVWSPPRGNHMVGTFHQVRRDGAPAFVEVSLISVEKDGVGLRMRHLHSGLEIPTGRETSSDFILKKVEKNRADFQGTGEASVVTVTYRLIDKNRLAQEVSFDPKTSQKGYISYYFRQK